MIAVSARAERALVSTEDAGAAVVVLSALLPFPASRVPAVVAVWQVTPTGYSPMHLFVLRFFMLEKALYEISYELADRPDWVGIPRRGVLALPDNEPAAP